jgi:hypothetical protein
MRQHSFSLLSFVLGAVGASGALCQRLPVACARKCDELVIFHDKVVPNQPVWNRFQMWNGEGCKRMWLTDFDGHNWVSIASVQRKYFKINFGTIVCYMNADFGKLTQNHLPNLNADEEDGVTTCYDECLEQQPT